MESDRVAPGEEPRPGCFAGTSRETEVLRTAVRNQYDTEDTLIAAMIDIYDELVAGRTDNARELCGLKLRCAQAVRSGRLGATVEVLLLSGKTVWVEIGEDELPWHTGRRIARTQRTHVDNWVMAAANVTFSPRDLSRTWAYWGVTASQEGRVTWIETPPGFNHVPGTVGPPQGRMLLPGPMRLPEGRGQP